MSRSLGVLTLDLIAKTSNFEQGMDRASRRTRSTTSEFEKAAAAAQKLALAAGAAAAAIAASSSAIVMNAAKAMDATSKMAQQIGVTTEALTGMRFAAQQFSSISDQQFDQAMRRMTRRIEEAAAGSGAAKKALEEMGLSARALSQMTPDRQMLALADAMKRTESQANRLRYTMAIFDTEGMALVPALQQGAAAFEENIKLAERYGVVLSTEAARAAEEFNTNLSHLGSILDGLKMRLASEVLPTLNSFISNVIQATTEVDGLHSEVSNLANDSSFKTWFESALVGLSRVADVAVVLARLVYAVGGSFQVVGADIEAFVAKTLRNIENLNPASMFDSTRYQQLLEEEKRVLENRSRVLEDAAQRWSDVWNLPGNKYEQAALASINTIRLQSDAVKLVDLTVQSATKATDANSAATKKNAVALTEAQRAAQNFRREQDQSLRSQLQAVSAIHSQAQALEDQIAVYGLGKTALEDLTIARLEEQAAMLRGFDGSQEAVEAIEREIEARKRLRTAIGSLEQKEAERQAWESWARDVEQIFDRVGQSLTDAIFDGGKSGRDLLRDLFKGLTFNILINPVMNQMQGWVTNQLGGLLGVQNPQQGGGMLGTAQNLYSGYNAITGGLNSTLGNAARWLGQKIGSEALTSFGLGLSGTTAATGIASLGAGLGASLGTSIGTSAAAMTTTTFSAALGGGAAAGGAAAGGAAGAAGIGSAVGAALPWIGGALAIGSAFGLFDDRLPTTRRSQQGASHMLPDGSWEVSSWDDRQDTASQIAARDFAQAAVKHANDLFERIGIDAQIHSFQTLMESSILGDKQGVGSSGQVRIGDVIRDIGLTVESSWTKHGFGGWSDQPMLPRLQTDIQLTILEAFQAVGDELPTVLSDMLADVDIRSLGAEQAQALAQSFQMVVDQVSALQVAVEQLPFEQLRDLSFDAAANLIQFAGGLEQLDAGMTAYFQNFYSEAERLDWLSKQVSGSLSELGLVMPDVTQGADEAKSAWRAIVESLDVTTEEGQRAYATMMTLSGSFAQLVTGMDQLSDATQRAHQELLNSLMGDVNAALSAVQQRGQERIAKLSESFARTDAVFNAYRSQVQALESQWGSLISTMDRSMRDLRGQVEASARLQYNQARAVISTALLTGQMPQTADLGEAIRAAQQGVTGGRYASAFDQREAYLKLANELEALQGIAKPELDAAQASLEQLEKQYNRLRGIEDLSGLSLKQLEKQFAVALSAEEAARTQISQIERQIAMAQAQYHELVGINDELSTLPGALQALAKAINAAAAAQQAQQQSGAQRSRELQYLADNPDVMAQYGQHGKGMTLEEYARLHYDLYGRKEGRSFDVGTPYVPYDMMANIHRGEIIINPRDSDILRRYGIEVQGGGSRETEQLLREQLAEVRQQNRYLYEIVKSGKRTERNTEDVANAIAHGDSDGGVVVVM